MRHRIKECKVDFLPPYSPELNPIKQMCSKKFILKKLSTKDPNEFKRAIKISYQSIQTSDVDGWFKHCGYVDQYFRKPL